MVELPTTIQNLVDYIVEQVQPNRVVLFGSRATGAAFEASDWDLAVDAPAMHPRDWLKLLDDVQTLPITLRAFDLVWMQDIDPLLLESIHREGIELYGRAESGQIKL